MPVLGTARRFYIGQGSTVTTLHDEAHGVLGSWSVGHEVQIQQESLSGTEIVQNFAIRSTSGITFDNLIIEGVDSVDRLAVFMAELDAAVDRAALGEFIADLALGKAGTVLWLRNMLSGNATVANPYNGLANLNGSPFSEQAWFGQCGARASLSNTALTPTQAQEAVWNPNGDEGGLAMITDTREGDAALQLERKRGNAAWTRITNATLTNQLGADVSTAGSAVSLDAGITGLQKDDRLRLRYAAGTTAGNSWSGRIAAFSPLRLQ